MRSVLSSIVVNGLLAIAAGLALFPLLWMVSVSFMAPGASNAFPPPLLPRHFTLGNYAELFRREGMARFFLNSLGLATAATLLALTFNVMAGYAFAKLAFAGRERLFQTLLAALVIPGQVAMMPLFLMLKTLGLVNSYVGVLIPSAAGVFGIFLVRQYAQSIPDRDAGGGAGSTGRGSGGSSPPSCCPCCARSW